MNVEVFFFNWMYNQNRSIEEIRVDGDESLAVNIRAWRRTHYFDFHLMTTSVNAQYYY